MPAIDVGRQLEAFNARGMVDEYSDAVLISTVWLFSSD